MARAEAAGHNETTPFHPDFVRLPFGAGTDCAHTCSAICKDTFNGCDEGWSGFNNTPGGTSVDTNIFCAAINFGMEPYRRAGLLYGLEFD